MEQDELRLANGAWTCLVSPEYGDRFQPEWFELAFWQDRSWPVNRGGRGAAWFLQDGNDGLLLRYYRRGGLIARVSKKHYIYGGEARTRSFAEFRLLRRLVAMGLPVPEAVAAGYQKAGIGYRAAIIMRRLDSVKPLGDLVSSVSTATWGAIGRLVRRFHDAGVYHADLNCFNILLGDEQIYLIDFDKGQLFSDATGEARWKRENILRLKRSLDKVREVEQETIAKGWRAFLSGYNG